MLRCCNYSVVPYSSLKGQGLQTRWLSRSGVWPDGFGGWRKSCGTKHTLLWDGGGQLTELATNHLFFEGGERNPVGKKSLVQALCCVVALFSGIGGVGAVCA
ncbi:unnamed protein product [Ectocarpus fasciculatus]